MITPSGIALDIDGTLIAPGQPHHALPDQTMTQVIGQLVQAGVTVVLATGRMFPGTLSVADHLGVTEPLICQQGASIQQHNGDLIHQQSLDPSMAAQLLEYAREHNWPYAWFDAHRYLASEPNPQSQYFADVSGVAIEYHETPQLTDVAPVGVDIISNEAQANRIHSELSEQFGDSVQLLDFTSVTAAHSPEATKGNAVRYLADRMGISAQQVMAIGDSANDASMLRWAGFGATPAHCDRYAREAADEILHGEGVDGVAQLLNHVLTQL